MSSKTLCFLILTTLSIDGATNAFTIPVSASQPTTNKIATSSKFIPSFHSLHPTDPEVLTQEQTTAVMAEDVLSDDKDTTQPTPILIRAARQLLQDLQVNRVDPPAWVVMSALVFGLLMFNPLPSDAAMSGGRMSGSFGASASSPTRVQTVSPSYSRRGGGYSRGFSSGYATGLGANYFSTPGYSFGYSTPFFTPSFGYYGNPGIITYNRGPGILPLLFLGGLFVTAATAFDKVSEGIAAPNSSLLSPRTSVLGPGSSVVKLTVALRVPNRDDPNSILSVLDRFSQKASRTGSRVGIQDLTSQVALELLRRKSSIVSASGIGKHYKNNEAQAQREFNAQAVEERSKFEVETVSNYGGIDFADSKSRKKALSTDGPRATMAVVTLLLHIDGDKTGGLTKSINSIGDVEKALQGIASDAKVEECLQSAEILWTPEDRSETLSLRDVVSDYPELRNL